jgi:hypothetical protein
MINTSPLSASAQHAMKKRNMLLLAGASTLVALGFATPAVASADIGFSGYSTLATAAGLAEQKVSATPLTAAAAVGLEELTIHIQPRAAAPILSVGLIGAEKTIQRGAPATFLGFTNYPSFIKQAELRVFAANAPAGAPPHAIVMADRNGVMNWTPTNYASDDMVYAYRVYDDQGRYDETGLRPLSLVSAAHILNAEDASHAGFGVIDSATERQIPLADAVSLLIHGTSAPEAMVRISDQLVPTDSTGYFSNAQLVPADCKDIMIGLLSPCGREQMAKMGRDQWQTAAPTPAKIDVAERADETAQPVIMGGSDGLQISVDPVDHPATPSPYSVKVRTDRIRAEPVLAVGLVESERTVVRGESATFFSYNNYPSFISKGEVRIFAQGKSKDSKPLAIVSANKDGVARWSPADIEEDALFYVYRVYDDEGQYDETRPEELTLFNEPFGDPTPPSRPLFGTRDEAAIRSIPMSKAITVTVTGNAAANDELVRVEGQAIPVQADGSFVSQQLVSRDKRQVSVTAGTEKEARFTAVRDVEQDKDDWFIVGQGDLTFVSNNGKGAAARVSGDPLTNGDHISSHAAFYAKGVLRSGVKITGALDTGETLLSDIFSNIDRKDPRQLLRRMDSNQYYTTYGDDSTLVEDAPTQGRFYLKVEKDKSSLLVGNFIADIQQSELAQLNRGVFGTIVDHKSLGATSFGESKLQLAAFASDPGTIPGRDEFRGTGGSLYFLKRRDITVGSERLSVEVRDRDTGLVISRTDLRPQEDYDIDYFQGRVVLLRPLSSTASDGSLVRQSSSPGNVPVLVVRYEYSPAVGDVSGYTVGGRAAGWQGDKLRVGITAQRETTDAADQTLLAADATIRLHAGTYVKAEVAQSEGPGFTQSNSVDGGLQFTDRVAAALVGVKAQAVRGEVALDFAEIQGKTGDRGKASAFFERFDEGFSGNGQLTQGQTQRWGFALNAPLGDGTKVDAKFEQLDSQGIGKRTVASADIAQELSTTTGLSVGLRHDDQALGLIGNSRQLGKRTDAAIQLSYKPLDYNWSVFAFGQMTVDRDATRLRNNRAGVGGKMEISDRVSLAAEVSTGDGGLGANVELIHRYGKGSEAYLGYGLLTDRTDVGFEPAGSLAQTNRGTLTVGARHRFSTALNIHGENKIGHGGEAPSVMRSFGFDWDPSERWSFSSSLENGRIDDENTGVFKRTAVTFGVGYTVGQVQLATSVEGRFEKGKNRDQDVWLFRNTASVQLDPDWRALGRLNVAIANNETTDVRAADYVEGTVGFAYRPILYDRLNLLARYTYLQDLGPIGQITSGGLAAAPKQKSQIMAIDANLDLTKTLTLGAKYGYRQGKVSLGRESDTFVSSDTHLGVLRLDWRLVKKWDAVVEGHYLTNDRAGDGKWGGIAAIYRHLGNHVKIGVGYSFSDYSSDLADQSYTSKGLFLNVLGKF